MMIGKQIIASIDKEVINKIDTVTEKENIKLKGRQRNNLEK